MAVTASILISFFIVLFATPSFIKVAELKSLFDEPGDMRKLHKTRIPSMGGIMIFAGTMFAFFICYPTEDISYIKYLVPSILVLFFIGIKDDIIGTAPVKKLIGHLLVAFIMVLMAEIKITSLYGIFEIREIPDWASIALSIFTYVVIINAFNLIDGIDGLAGGVACIAAISFGIWFLILDCTADAIIAFSLAGALLGFLRFNFHPAKIFMGDSGSLIVGLIICVLAIRVIEYRPEVTPESLKWISKPVFAMAVLSYPLIDTFRIFMYRIFNGNSPFQADNNHIHHRLIKMGFSHSKLVAIVYVANAVIILSAILVKSLNTSLQFLLVSGIAALSLVILYLLPIKKSQKKEG